MWIVVIALLRCTVMSCHVMPYDARMQLGPQEGLADVKPGPEGGGNRGQLFTQIVRVLTAKQPHAFLLENVPGLLQCDGGRAMATIISALEGAGAGYDVSWEVVNARCLTAQARKRLFIVGLRRTNHNISKSTQDEAEGEGAGEGERGGGGQSGSNQNQREVRPFEFPFIPDLGLRASDVLQPELDADAATSTATSSSSGGVGGG